MGYFGYKLTAEFFGLSFWGDWETTELKKHVTINSDPGKIWADSWTLSQLLSEILDKCFQYHCLGVCIAKLQEEGSQKQEEEI